jgi:hypothetical protein
MTQQVRSSYRKHPRATWAVVLVAMVAAALAVVWPAFGRDTSPCVGSACIPIPHPSGQGITPSLEAIGGSNFSCGSVGSTYGGAPAPSGLRQFQISKPTPGDYTHSSTGVTFHIEPGIKGGFSFSVVGNAAAVYHVGVNGGTSTVWYDYYNNSDVLATPALLDGGVFSDTDLHSTPDSKYAPTPASKNTFFVASHTTFCYRPLQTTPPLFPRCDDDFGGTDLNGTGGTVEYRAQLVFQGTSCKNESVLMYSQTIANPNGSNEFFATLNPVTPGGPEYEVVERIHWEGATGDNQHLITLRYDDTRPYDGVENTSTPAIEGWRVMELCGSDPRPDPNDFELGAVSPALGADDNGPHTTCMLQSTVSAGEGPNGRTYDAWLYSKIDGSRGA